jgi:hypothetical protein
MMACFLRLWEKLSGAPHQHRVAERVKEAADDLSASARHVREQLRPYEDAPDPFVALMADLYRKRQIANYHRASSSVRS